MIISPIITVMQKIVPHLWFSTEAKAATQWYTSLFPDSKIISIRTLTDTPSGDCDTVSFTLANQEFMAISAGPYFKLNPAISLFVDCKDEQESDQLWHALADGGEILMPYQSYDWAKKYGWLQDKFGVSWQISVNGDKSAAQKITPALLFTQKVAGQAQNAIKKYTSIFPDSHIDSLVHYEAGDGDNTDFLKHARFTLCGQHFIAMDSSMDHAFTFNEAVSLIVRCNDQAEIDSYWTQLSADPAAEQCGWLKDVFGVSWQIVPTVMDTMMAKGTQKQVAAVTQAFLKMKKFDIAQLQTAFTSQDS